MKKVSIQDFKQHLSEYVTAAESGDEVILTRHNRPVATLSSSELRHLRVGRRAGRGSLRPAVAKGTGGRALEILLEDRYGGVDR